MRIGKFLLLGFSLFIVGIFILLLGNTKGSVDEYSTSFSSQLEDKLRQIEKDFDPLVRLLATPDLLEVDFTTFETKETFYIYNNDQLIFWTSNQIVPEVLRLRRDKPILFFEKAGWQGIIRQWSALTGAGDSRLVVFIPIIYNPPIQNQYQQPWSNSEFLYSPNLTFNTESNQHSFQYNGEELFSYQFGDTYVNSNIKAQLAGSILMSLAFLIFLVAAHSANINDVINLKFKQAAIRFILLTILFFGTSLWIKNQELVNELYVFSSKIYASSSILNCLYTLIVFAFLILEGSIVLATIFTRMPVLRWVRNFKGRLALGVLSVITLYYLFTLQFLFIRNLYDNSQATLDIYHSLAVSPLRVISFLLIILHTLTLYFLFNGLLRIWLISIIKRWQMILSFIIGTAIYFVIENDFPVYFIICMLSIYLVFVLWSDIYRYYLKTNYLSLLYLVSIIIVSAVLVSFSIYTLEKEKTIENLKTYANQNLIDEDIFAEYLINEAVNEVQSDPFISYWMTSPFVSKEIISRKIRQEYLGRYLKKYNIQILLFNQAGTNINESGVTMDYFSLANRYAVEQNKTDFENVYHVNRLRSNFFKRYQAFIEIKRYDIVVGHLILDLNQKRTFKPNVYPELIIDMRLVAPYSSMNISYAMFSRQELLFEGGEYNYVKDFEFNSIQEHDFFEKGKVKNDYLHIGIKLENDRVVIVSTKGYDPLEIVSNFSFLFLIMILLLGIVLIIVSWLRLIQRPLTGFAVRIQLFMNLAFIIPLLLVSFTTVSLLNSASITNIQTEYLIKGKSLAESIQRPLDNYLVIPSSRDDLEDILRQTASTLGTDADLFNLAGGLIVSTQSEIYDKGLKSRYIDPGAFEQLIQQSASSYTTDSNVGDLSYSATYIPVKTSDTGRLVGILSLPFFDYKETLEVQQIEVLSNILNIFSLLFIVLLFLSFLVSKRLVYPLNIISDKLNKMSFSGYNEPIEWNSEDEIGRLVGEYNTMISNLAESREALARNERELAWREIAKHVAHEIKNPLTPMKLTLQQLQRRLTGKKEEENEWIEKPVDTLLHQVDVLKDIASSFSAFAKMPIPEIKEFDLTGMLKRTLALHQNELEISSSNLEECVLAKGDEKLMGRIITNIILNAKQAGGNQTHIHVSVKSGNNILIALADDGPGIPENYKDKIFLPGFSTKETGSGIGLSVAKHGIEQSGGQIWFETSEEGTTFYIELPGVK